jgi:hypothetical protein
MASRLKTSQRFLPERSLFSFQHPTFTVPIPRLFNNDASSLRSLLFYFLSTGLVLVSYIALCGASGTWRIKERRNQKFNILISPFQGFTFSALFSFLVGLSSIEIVARAINLSFSIPISITPLNGGVSCGCLGYLWPVQNQKSNLLT